MINRVIWFFTSTNKMAFSTIRYWMYSWMPMGLLWAGLDNGIDLISPESNLTFYYDPTGELGSVYAMQIKDNMLYAGTNQGLFYSRF